MESHYYLRDFIKQGCHRTRNPHVTIQSIHQFCSHVYKSAFIIYESVIFCNLTFYDVYLFVHKIIFKTNN
jgi:hypothetical protein